MGFLKPVLVVAFVAWLCYRIFVISRHLRIMGLGVPVFSHAPGPCKIFHVNGSEDIDVLPNGLALISSGLQYHFGPNSDPAMSARDGNIYSFDYNKPDQGLKELVLENFDKSEFIPHGIALYTDSVTEETTLFVVNHGGGKESIEIFQFDQETLALKHRRTVMDDTIYFPNDIVGVGPDSFYVTNDHYFDNYLLKQVEIFYPLSTGNVVFYNGTHSSIAASQIVMANGINVDKTGRYVFVAAILAGEILVFERKDDNSLEMQQVISIGGVLDNIWVDENGNIWTGASGICFLEYAQNFSKPCTARALQVKLSRDDNGNVPFKVDDIVEAYSTKGDGEIKGASSAAYYKGKLLIGTVFSNLMYCDVLAL